MQYWAKEIHFGNETENTLNYNIRIFGRRSVLVLNSVAGMSQLPEIERNTPAILSGVEFNSGNRYADFNPASGDKVASYPIWQKEHDARIDSLLCYLERSAAKSKDL